MAQETFSLLCIKVTTAQHEAIRELYYKNNWSLTCVKQDDHVKLWHMEAVLQDVLRDQEDNESPPLPSVDLNHPDSLCPACLCRPCCTNNDNRQLWWPVVNTLPNPANRTTRLKIYKCFWAMLLNRGVWKDPRYIDRKTRAMALDPYLKDFVCHKRDIMPECVLKLVRSWYPNLEGEPYISHKWDNAHVQ